LFEVFGIGELATKSLRMHATQYLLIVAMENGKLVVQLGSRRKLLLKLVQDALRQEQGGAKRTDLLQQLQRTEGQLKELIEYENADNYSGKSIEKIREETGQIATLLEAIGSVFSIDDLEHLGHPSIYVEGNMLKEEYRSDVRGKFYPSGYRKDTLRWKETRLATLINPSDPTQFKCEVKGTWEPLIRPGSTEKNSNVTIDHIDMVCDHWNSKHGNDMNQNGRTVFYNGTGTMRLAAWKNNSSDGAQAAGEGLRYTPTVGPNFRGPEDKD